VTADATPPVISISGANPLEIELGTAYAEPGVSASDNVDGSVSVTIGGATVDANTIGDYIVTYNASDAAGNAAIEMTRTVTVFKKITSFTINAIADDEVTENTAYTGVIPGLSGDTPIGNVTYVLTGADKDDFSIESNGVVSMVARDFEAPVDADTLNTYDLTITAIKFSGYITCPGQH